MRSQQRTRIGGVAAAEVVLIAGLALLSGGLMLVVFTGLNSLRSAGNSVKATPLPVYDFAYSPATEDMIIRGLNGHLAQLTLNGRRVDAVPSWVPGQVMSLTRSADGNFLITGRLDGMVVVEDMTTGNDRVRVLEDHTMPVIALAISRDGTQFASGDSHGNIRVWDFKTCTVRATLSAHTGRGRMSLSWLPDDRLVSAGVDGVARLWDVAGTKLLREFVGDDGPILSASVSPDGQQLVTGGMFGTVRLWDVETAAERWRRMIPHQHIGAVAFDRECSQLVCATLWNQNNLFVLDPEDGRVIRRLPGHRIGIRKLQFIENGTQLVSAGLDGTVRVWDAPSWRLVRILECAI